MDPMGIVAPLRRRRRRLEMEGGCGGGGGGGERCQRPLDKRWLAPLSFPSFLPAFLFLLSSFLTQPDGGRTQEHRTRADEAGSDFRLPDRRLTTSTCDLNSRHHRFLHFRSSDPTPSFILLRPSQNAEELILELTSPLSHFPSIGE